MQIWTSVKIVRLGLSDKTLSLTKYENIMLNLVVQTIEK